MKEKIPTKRAKKNHRKIMVGYAGKEYIIRFDGQQFIPELFAENTAEGFVDGGYFSSIGGAVKKIISTSIADEPGVITLDNFVKRYEKAVSEIMAIKEDDLSIL